MLSRQIMATRPAYSDSEDSRAHLEALRFLTGLAKDRAESVAGGSSMDLSHIRHLLAFDRWDRAFAWLRAKSVGRGADADVQALPHGVDAEDMHAAIMLLVDKLYEQRNPVAGAYAFAWLMMAANPKQPDTFLAVLPYLEHVIDQVPNAADQAELERRFKVWWEAIEGNFVESRFSIFALASGLLDPVKDDAPAVFTLDAGEDNDDSDVIGIRVFPQPTTALKKDHADYKAIVGKVVPLVIARGVADVRRTLVSEYPHAVGAVDLLLRDIREGEPVRMNPAILVGSPGAGKSRLLRRFGQLFLLGVYRFDGGSSQDGVGYGGTARGWAESTPCVPARAVLEYRQSNPIVLVDELDKAGGNSRHGMLWRVLLAHLERETAERYRDHALDAELDLSWVNHVATANDVTQMPDHLRDRYRIIRVPDPGLAYLPALAANVVRDLAVENGTKGFEILLAADELEVIGRAWKRAGFTMRKLQKIVAATIAARDANATRH